MLYFVRRLNVIVAVSIYHDANSAKRTRNKITIGITYEAKYILFKKLQGYLISSSEVLCESTNRTVKYRHNTPNNLRKVVAITHYKVIKKIKLS